MENPTGWVIRAIQEGYTKAAPAPKTKKTAAAAKGNFDNFEQQNYDFDSIEYAVLHEDPAAEEKP